MMAYTLTAILGNYLINNFAPRNRLRRVIVYVGVAAAFFQAALCFSHGVARSNSIGPEPRRNQRPSPATTTSAIAMVVAQSKRRQNGRRSSRTTPRRRLLHWRRDAAWLPPRWVAGLATRWG